MKLLWALRSALFILWMAATVVPWGLAMLVLSIFIRGQKLYWPTMFWLDIAIWGCKHICGVDYRVTGLNNLPKRGDANKELTALVASLETVSPTSNGEETALRQQAQRLLEGARLEVAAIEDRELVPLRLRLRLHVRDLGRDLLRFRLVVLALDDADRRTVRVLAPELLLEEVLVVRDHRVRGTQDARAAAVVLLELHDAQRGVVARELAQVLGVGAAFHAQFHAVVEVGRTGQRELQRLHQAALRRLRPRRGARKRYSTVSSAVSLSIGPYLRSSRLAPGK